MSWDFYVLTTQVARKDYICQASKFIDDGIGWDEEDYAKEDRPTIRKAIKEKCKILKGTEYIKIKGKWDGEFATFRARKDLDDICSKYELYE